MPRIRRATIWLVVYACAPDVGSEPGVGWSFAQAALAVAETHDADLIILTQRKNARNIEERIVRDSSRARIVGIDLPWGNLWLKNLSHRLHYSIWSLYLGAMLRAKSVVGENDVVHHVTFATASLPTPLWLLPATGIRILGPVGGLAANSSQSFNQAGRFRRLLARVNESMAFRHAEILLAQNPRFAREAEDHVQHVILEPNACVDVAVLPRASHTTSPSEVTPIRIVCVGALNERKRFDAVVRAMPFLESATLTIVGDGPSRDFLKQVSTSVGVSRRVTFTGHVTRDRVMELVADSSVLVLPSSNESAGWAVAEAATLGVPSVVCADTGGAGIVQMGGTGVAISDRDILSPPKLASAIQEAAQTPRVCSLRWLESRLPHLLSQVYRM